MHRRGHAARPERHRQVPPDGRQRPAADRMGHPPGPPRQVGVRHRLMHGLRRLFGQHAGQSARSLRPAVRRTDAGRPARRRLPVVGRPAGDQHCRLPDASRLGRRHAGKGRAGRGDHGRPGRIRAAVALRRRTGPSRLRPQRGLRIQGQRRKAVRSRLSDGKPRLQGHPGPRRMQPAAVERQRLLPARRLRLHRLHRAGLRIARPRLPGNAQAGRHPDRPADRHAESLVRRTRSLVQVGDAEAGAQQRRRGSSGGHAGDPQERRRQVSRIVVGPFNRVEGDLEVALELDAGRIVSAQVNSPLFRGFEQILVGRAPLDALAIVPRICGICSVAQSAAAASALADAMGLNATVNGKISRNLICATENLADHLTHFYLFFMPDFARPAYAGRSWYPALARRFSAVSGEAAAEVLPARAGFLRLMGFLAGRWPHTLAIQPGGSTRAITAGERIRLLALQREFRSFLEKRLFGDALPAVGQLASKNMLLAWAAGRSGDFPAFLNAASDLGLDQVGRASDAFLSYGAYDLFAAGTWQAGQNSASDPVAVDEDTTSAWLASSPPRHPLQGETVVDAGKPEAYTWCKAPRYAGQPYEVGALARQVVAGHPLLLDLVRQDGGSVMARVVARLLELALILPEMERWVQALQPGGPFCIHGEMPDEATGSGLVEAARGSLGHWLSIKRGRIERYQIIAPTTWNFSPRDSNAQPGPLEQALVGLPACPDAPPTVQHVVRSFDPCMVCTVH